jgi:hypothetical protein
MDADQIFKAVNSSTAMNRCATLIELMPSR